MHLIANPLCLALYSSTAAGDQLRLYSVLIPMLYCDAIVDAMIKGLGQQTASVRYNIFTSSMDVVLLFLLLPRYGMTGYFFSFLVTHLINFILSLRRLLKTTQIRIPFYIPAFTGTAALAGVFGASFLPGIPGRISAFFGLYGSLLVLFGVVSKADIRWLRGLIAKK